jgi:hypothetical protein
MCAHSASRLDRKFKRLDRVSCEALTTLVQVIPALVAMSAVYSVTTDDRLDLFSEADRLPDKYKAIIGHILMRRFPSVRSHLAKQL